MKKKFYQSSNFWHNLVTLFLSVFTAVNLQEVGEAAHGLINTVFAEKIEWAAIIGGAYTLVNMVYQLFIKPGQTPNPVPAPQTPGNEKM